MGAKLLKWGIFPVVVSLIPFVLVALSLWSDDKVVLLSSLWPHGELLLVSTSLAAEAVGDLIPTGPGAERVKIVSAGSCVILLIVAALWYALIQGHAYRVSKISEGSIVLFLFTVMASACCKLLAER
jgi:hypothetical protein